MTEHKREAPEAIIALWLGRVGDLIVSTAFLRSLRQGFPSARITLATSALCAEAAELIPFVDDALFIGRWDQAWSNLRSCLRLRALQPDLLIDLNPSLSKSGAALAWLSGAEMRLGFEKGRLGWALTDAIEAAAENEHMLDRYARLAAALELRYELRPELALGPEHEGQASAAMPAPPEGRPRILIHPGNFKKVENRWPESKFVELTRLALKEGWFVAYLAGPGENEPVKAIVSEIGQDVPLISGLSLGGTGALMRRFDLCVLNATGTLHLAAAMDIPTFAFYARYTDTVWRPRGPRHKGLVSGDWESCRDIGVSEAWSALKSALPGPAALRR
ncbi:MAG: glycosyltransferase family 9 protein [Elusimicrobia bacterium]|nr:glycosyltransferase family 9 protein [Elusimicrobiota bacterium]